MSIPSGSTAPTRLYRTIATQISSRIQAGEFVPGERLPSERELADTLGVSRPSIREALIALEIEGMVDVRVGTGVFVLPAVSSIAHDQSAQGQRVQGHNLQTHHTPEALELGPFDLLDARMIIEPECAALAAQRASPAQIADLAAAHHASADLNTRDAHDRAFHHAIGVASGNTVLAAILSHLGHLAEVSPLYSRFERHPITQRVWNNAYQEHARILMAIEERNPIRARHAMYLHLDGVLQRMRADVGDEATALP